MSPYQDEKDGVSAGGKWMEFQSEDKMTGAKKVRFELLSNNYFREDPDYKPRVELFCKTASYKLADFNPGVRLPPPNRPGFWGQPQLEVRVRIDDVSQHQGWNWVRGHFLSMDKGTDSRPDRRPGLQDRTSHPQRAPDRRILPRRSESGPSASKACDITPKKPSKD